MVDTWFVKHEKIHRAAPFICLAVALCLMVIGILERQPDSVLAKAVKICLECVGIG